MSRELKLGILSLITLFATVWGYKFIKGQDLLHKSTTFYSTFSDVTGLAVSSDVSLNGYKVGTVTQIKLNPADVKSMDVFYRIDGKIDIPKDAIITLRSEGLVGGKILALSFTKPCSGADCAQDGQKLQSKTLGLLGSMVDPSEIGVYTDGATSAAKNILANLGKDGSDAKVDLIVSNLNTTLANMTGLTSNLNKMILQSNQNINAVSGNLTKITKNIADNNAEITALLKNLNTTSGQLAQADLSKTVGKTNTMLDQSQNTIKSLEKTLETTSATMNDLNALVANLNKGNGSLGLLMHDKKLYSNMEATSRQLALLLQDLRLNPRRYLNVSLIARKDKNYTYPALDPAVDTLKH
jgi:phospholipid/cholesterol/gamma-HCH transport system substrate-binding protein